MLKNSMKTTILVTLAVLISGCTGAPPGSGEEGEWDRTSSYDVTTDPIVNPDEIFEAFPADDTSKVDYDAVLVRHLVGEPRNLHPILVNSWFDFYFQSLLFSFVYRRDETLTWKPAMERLEWAKESDDHLITTIKLKPGQTFHDGHPLTTKDIKFTWEAINSPDVPAYYYKHMVSQIVDIKILDELTLEFHHAKASPMNAQNMGFPIIPKHIYGKADELANDPTMSRSDYYVHLSREGVVGAGPYKFVEWRTNDRVVVERWKDFPYERPHFARQILKVQPDRNIALLMFKSGDLDEIWLTPKQFATQSNDEEFKEHGVKGYYTRRMFAYIGWNMDGSNPFFEDVRVRQAMAYAYDTDRVLKNVTYNLYTESNGIFDSQHWAHNPDTKPIRFNLDRAAELLDEAGWLVDDEDGWRYKEIDGTKVKFEFDMMMANSFSYSIPMVDTLRDNLKKIGVSFTFVTIENAAFDNRYLSHDFESIVSVWEVTNDPSQWRNHFHTDEYDGGRNVGGYSNARVDELMDLSQSSYDPEVRAPYFREMQQIIYDEQPHLFMWNYTMLHGFNKKLRGINFSPAGVFLYGPAERAWWFPKETASNE
ncbi:MAG: ABC transporter substrate-binding protein [Candidatus Hydrogenedentota bacterium]